jgi:hypothetical protein
MFTDAKAASINATMMNDGLVCIVCMNSKKNVTRGSVLWDTYCKAIGITM